MARFKKLLFCQKHFFLASNFFMQMFNESILCRHWIVSAQAVVQAEFPAYALSIHMSYKIAQYICIVYAKYQKASVKALVQVDFPVYALSKQKQNKKKMAKFTKLSFSQKLIFWHKTSSRKCSMCLYYVGKVSDSFSQNCGTSWFPCACTIWALTKPLLRSKVLSSKRCHIVKKYFYGIKLLHANVQCIYIVYAKYQMASAKTLIKVDFPVHVLSEH